MSHQTVHGVCGVCDAGCSVHVVVEDGVLKQVRPRNDHPNGSCCIRGNHAPEIVYSPDRVLYPLRRTGTKGTMDFERISWNEALDTIADRLKAVAAAYGPQSLCMYTGRGNFERSLCDIFAPSGTAESSASSLLFPLGLSLIHI